MSVNPCRVSLSFRRAFSFIFFFINDYESSMCVSFSLSMSFCLFMSSIVCLSVCLNSMFVPPISLSLSLSLSLPLLISVDYKPTRSPQRPSPTYRLSFPLSLLAADLGHHVGGLLSPHHRDPGIWPHVHEVRSGSNTKSIT